LIEERSAVDEAIKEFRFERFRSENMGSIARSPQEVCDEMAEDCDLFILIVGARYGWVIPELNISVTEREYDIAKKNNPGKILVYIKDVERREERAKKFMDKVSDFKTGYFRPKPFDSLSALKDQAENDISIWPTDRINKSKLSPINVLDLKEPSIIASSFIQMSIALTIILLGIKLACKLTENKVIDFSFQEIAFSLFEYNKVLMSSILWTIVNVLFSFGIGMFISMVITSSIIYFMDKINFSLSHTHIFSFASSFFLILFTFLFIMGFYMLNLSIDSIAFISLLFLSIGLFLRSINAAIQSINSYEKEIYKFKLIIKNLLISKSVIYNFSYVYFAAIVGDILFGYSRTGLGKFIMESRAVFRIDMVILGLIAIAFTYWLIFSLLRFVQSYLGWEHIIKPMVIKNIYRSKL